MKPKSSIAVDTSPYLQYFDSFGKERAIKDFSDIEKQLLYHPLFSKFLDNIPCGIGIVDFQQAKYLYVSDGASKIFTGYSKEEIMKGGVLFYATMVHPYDWEIYQTSLWPKMMEILKSLKRKDIINYKFSFNYRFIRKNGEEIKILQSTCFLETDENNNPLLGLTSVTDITHYKINNLVMLTVSYCNDKIGEKTIISESFLPSDMKIPFITSRESDIIRHIAGGKSSKEIAARLHISEFTVRAHRRNIFEKTNVKNSAELTRYAYSNGLL